ncbi:MAG: hypothetical protein WCN98_06170 [Verrucomicrobiaceae bacterium]
MKRKLLLPTLLLLLAGCAAFGWIQNHRNVVGGAISLPKVLWLNLAIASFLVIPAFLWRDARVISQLRQLYGWFLASFAMRAVIELPVIYFTHSWRCAYGITHDLIMMALVIILSLRMQRMSGINSATKLAGLFAPLLLLVLTCEILNAWLFSRVADPQAGIYYASTSDVFRTINIITRIEVTVIYPLLGYWMLKWNSLSIQRS